MLTISKLKNMKPHNIFNTGETELSPWGQTAIYRWVAIRGGIHDWAIYYGHVDKDDVYISKYGDKLHDMSKVQELVKCDKEALDMYRH